VLGLIHGETIYVDGRSQILNSSERSDDISGTNNSRPDKDEKAESGLVSQLAMMSRRILVSPTRNTVAPLAIALFIVIAATAYGQNSSQWLESAFL
jgi:hypothetical protein